MLEHPDDWALLEQARIFLEPLAGHHGLSDLDESCREWKDGRSVRNPTARGSIYGDAVMTYDISETCSSFFLNPTVDYCNQIWQLNMYVCFSLIVSCCFVTVNTRAFNVRNVK